MMEEIEKIFNDNARILEGLIKDDKTVNIHIWGGFLSGKNEILHSGLEALQKNNEIDLLAGAFVSNIENVYELIPALSQNSEHFTNSLANKKRFGEILNILNESNEELLRKTMSFVDLTNVGGKPEGLFESLSNVLIRKSDLRMIEQFAELIAEALVIDLLNIFYPNKSQEELLLSKKNENKPRIVIWIAKCDNYFQKLSQTLVPTLEKCINKISFGEFISFDIDIEDKDFLPKDLLDIKIITSSRKSDVGFEAETIACGVDLLSKDYTEESSRLFFQEISERPSDFGGTDKDFLIKIRNDLLYPFSGNEAYFLLCSAFVSQVSSASLKIFDNIEKYHSKDEILRFVNENSEYFYQDGNKYTLLPFYKFLIKEIISRTEEDFYEDLTIRATAYEDVASIAEGSGDDFDFLRNLAYFKNFDKENAISKAYLEDADKINSIIDSQKKLFSNNEFTMTLGSSDRTKLLKYNEFADGDKYFAKKEMVASIWNATKNDFDVMLTQYRSEISTVNKQIENINEKNKSLDQTLENLSKQLLKIENVAINLKQEIAAYEKPKSEKLVTALFALGVTLVVLTTLELFFMVDLSSIFLSSLPLVISCGIIGIGLTIAMSKGVFRIWKYNRNENVIGRIKSEIKNNSEGSDEIIAEINIVRADMTANSAKLTELSTDIANYNITIGELGRKLSEPFYSD